MKKFFAVSVVTVMIMSLGTTLAQSFQQHEVEVRLPNVLIIRLTAGNSVSGVTNPTAVAFDFTTTAATFEPIGTYEPTNTANWDDVRVFANGGGWQVTVATDNDEFDWSKLAVTPHGGDYSLSAFNLPVNSSVQIFNHNSRTSGWRSLGFGPAQFSLTLDGTEVAGTYSTIVTYTIANP